MREDESKEILFERMFCKIKSDMIEQIKQNINNKR